MSERCDGITLAKLQEAQRILDAAPIARRPHLIATRKMLMESYGLSEAQVDALIAGGHVVEPERLPERS